MKITCLVYTSRAEVEFTPTMVAELARKATARNALEDVTGLLVHGGGRFLQVLEGDYFILRKLYTSIVRDPRHTDCQVLIEDNSTQRRFPGWQMGHLALGAPRAKDYDAWDELCTRPGSLLGNRPVGSDAVLTMVREFISRFGSTAGGLSQSA
ncbi:MAG: BLUF domain-containing protein [Planctomycetota bacterium]